jgi:hypothetical protein
MNMIARCLETEMCFVSRDWALVTVEVDTCLFTKP